MERGGLSYDVPGGTCPSDAVWGPTPAGFRRHQSTVRLGHGERLWSTVAEEVLAWKVKERSGFGVPPMPVAVDEDVTITALCGPFRVREPARVVAVVATPDRVGFAYGTRSGHPVSGEEAFVVHREPGGSVYLTVRSLTRAPRGRWLPAYPLALALQPFYRRRYRRALMS